MFASKSTSTVSVSQLYLTFPWARYMLEHGIRSLAPWGITARLIWKLVDKDNNSQNDNSRRARFENALQPLLSFSLVSVYTEYEQTSYRLHQLVSLWKRIQITATAEVVPSTLTLVSENFPEPSVKNLRQCTTYLLQATAITSYIRATEHVGSRLESMQADLQFLMDKFHRHASNVDQATKMHQASYEFFLQA